VNYQRSYFYRMHRACDDAQRKDETGGTQSDEKLLAAVDALGMEIAPAA
jgi:hypothetical protein